ncbi:MAG: toll/interleukin-1 receptor domain-containing protein [Opitutaceae bacterium]
MSQPPAFDVFLSHSNKDKPAVRTLRDRLLAHQLTVWFDEDELRPGIPWQQLLEDGILQSRSVAVVVGESGAGPWETEEMRAALQLAVDDKETLRPVIPVLLRGAHKPALPLFLRSRTWVDLGAGDDDEKALSRLLWGITGRKPGAAAVPPPLPPAPKPERPRRKRAAKPAAAAMPAAEPLRNRNPRQVLRELGLDLPLALPELLPGAWQVRIQNPFAMANLQLVLTAEGSFRGELLTPMGRSIVDGQWKADAAANQIQLQGRQAAGFQVMPYYALVQVTFFDAQQIVGVSAAGEQVTWHKQTPAA